MLFTSVSVLQSAISTSVLIILWFNLSISLTPEATFSYKERISDLRLYICSNNFLSCSSYSLILLNKSSISLEPSCFFYKTSSYLTVVSLIITVYFYA